MGCPDKRGKVSLADTLLVVQAAPREKKISPGQRRGWFTSMKAEQKNKPQPLLRLYNSITYSAAIAQAFVLKSEKSAMGYRVSSILAHSGRPLKLRQAPATALLG